MARTSFLDLPPEIRVEVYSYAIVERHPVQILIYRSKVLVPEPDLLVTCRLIRKEAMPIFYGSNTFEPMFDKKGRATAAFLDSLSDEKIPMLRALRAYEYNKTGLASLVYARLLAVNRPKWILTQLNKAKDRLSEIIGHGRGLLRRDAVLVPYIQAGGHVMWCTEEEVIARHRLIADEVVVRSCWANSNPGVPYPG